METSDSCINHALVIFVTTCRCCWHFSCLFLHSLVHCTSSRQTA